MGGFARVGCAAPVFLIPRRSSVAGRGSALWLGAGSPSPLASVAPGSLAPPGSPLACGGRLPRRGWLCPRSGSLRGVVVAPAWWPVRPLGWFPARFLLRPPCAPLRCGGGCRRPGGLVAAVSQTERDSFLLGDRGIPARVLPPLVSVPGLGLLPRSCPGKTGEGYPSATEPAALAASHSAPMRCSLPGAVAFQLRSGNPSPPGFRVSGNNKGDMEQWKKQGALQVLPRNHNPYQSDVNRIFRPPCGLFPPVNKPEIVNYLIPKHPGGTNHLPRRTQQNIVILLRSSGLFIGQGWLPCPTQQNHCCCCVRLSDRFFPP